MCIRVYLGSDRPLPAVPWDDSAPGFHARPVGDAGVLETLGHYGFRFRHVLEAGSFMGCGCGLTFGAWSRNDPREDHALRVRDVRDLFGYLAAQHAGRTLVLFSTDFEGEINPASRGGLDPRTPPAEDAEFEFLDKVLLDVAASR